MTLEVLPTAERWSVSRRVNASAPAHWKRVRLNTLAVVDNGCPFESSKFNTQGRGLPLIRIRDVGKADTDTYFDGDYESRYLVHAGDWLIGMDGEFRLRQWVGRDGLLNQRVCRIRFTCDATTAAFVTLVLQRHLSAVELATSSVTVKHLSSRTVEDLEIATPPLDEMEVLVSRLTSALQHRRSAALALDEVPALLDRLRQSILAAAFRGDLTADWRAENPDVEPASELLKRIRIERRRRWEEAELAKMVAKGKAPKDDKWKAKYEEPEPVDESELPELPEGWCWVSAEEVVDPAADIVYGIVQPGPETPNGVPYIRGMDIEDGRILVDQLRRTHASIAQRYERASLRGGDVLLGIIRATKVAVVPTELDGANITQGTARFRPWRLAQTEFLAGWLASPWAQNWLHSKYRGIDMPGLNLSDVRRLPVPVAPLSEQALVAAAATSALARVSILSGSASHILRSAVALDSSVLQQAFGHT